MNTSKRALRILLPVLILTVASLGCGLLTPPTPTPEPTNTPEPTDTPVPTETPVPTPTSTPTPTPVPLPELTSFTNAQMGLSISYPADWYMEEEEGVSTSSVIFATEEDFEPDETDGAALGIVTVPLAGADLSGVEELWEAFAAEATDGETAIGEPESLTIGGEDAVRGSYGSEEDDYDGWLTMVIAEDYGYAFLAVVSPAEDLEDYITTFDAMMDSVEFSEPSASGGDDGGDEFGARDDVPTPADAEVTLNMQAMVSYLTEATIPEAVQFIEDNWPDYGWEADTTNILHQPGEGLLFYTKGSETAMIAVDEDDESPNTSVVILIVEEEEE
jgi:hypothetical protein